MEIHIHHHYPEKNIEKIFEEIKLLNFKLNKIMENQTQLAADLVAVNTQFKKGLAEILSKIQALEDANANAGNTTPEVDAALADLKATAQAIDDVVPDPAPPADQPTA